MNRTTPQCPLPRRGWRPAVHAALQALLEAKRPDAGPAPVAVFDFDNTCILNDIGELFSHYLIEEMRYRYDLDAFWDLIHLEDGREPIRGLTERLAEVPRHEWAEHVDYRTYLAEMGAVYNRKLIREGKAACYEWAVRLHVGMRPEEIHRWAAEAIRQELDRELVIEERRTERGEVARVRRGIRMFREIHDLMDALRARGFEIWIVSASNVWTVEVFARHFGVPAERVLGNHLAPGADGRLTADTVPPVLFRQGKVEAIEAHIGRTPTLAFGDADTDFEMLCAARELAVVIDRGNTLLREEAGRRAWPLQPQGELTHMDREGGAP